LFLGGGLGPDFFISLAPHHEWFTGHTVWGTVIDMAALDVIKTQPVLKQVWGAVAVETLKNKIAFNSSVTLGPKKRRRRQLRLHH
jgi:hypothetical protein